MSVAATAFSRQCDSLHWISWNFVPISIQFLIKHYRSGSVGSISSITAWKMWVYMVHLDINLPQGFRTVMSLRRIREHSISSSNCCWKYRCPPRRARTRRSWRPCFLCGYDCDSSEKEWRYLGPDMCRVLSALESVNHSDGVSSRASLRIHLPSNILIYLTY